MVRAALARKQVPASDVDEAIALDARHRDAVGRLDGLRATVKTLSAQVGRARKEGRLADAEQLTTESKQAGQQVAELEAEAALVETSLRSALLRLPNLPADEAPDGLSEADNVVIRVENFDPERYQSHHRVPHWEIGAQLGILDSERGAKISGSMFPLLRGMGATLSRALCQLALDRNADAFEEMRPPTLVLSATLEASGQLPKFADEAYQVERDGLWAIPTAEVPLTSVRRGEILDEADLPQRFMAYTPCLRREAGSAGRDTRGLLRSHEFDKVEILAIGTREQAPALHAELLGRAEGVLVELGLPYRIVDICTGDLGQTQARQFDIDVYAPGVDQWLEVSSVSWFSDYQARRAAIRYRPAGGGPNRICDTLNGSALAVPRVWAALLETYREPDGSVRLPSCLHPYLRGATTIPAPG